uniref:Protein TIC 214 n=1 Tax=Kingdonia uniflora TaxID=39325 RepID=A0A286LS45_9MAGN|nr:hypothetical chloroplast RF1 [Kingdonia uniflora]YP_009427951.1 hypothetical chloroplast RF1 [Kingdonia uniflora]ASV47820.1 hypothetical chloroplast RF1 [Kingdonia uniflora]ASV47827.1 hypothetical chloroplast RF1 [Kingdonia uniflora]
MLLFKLAGCKRIIHSVVVVGLYFGLLTTLSIGPAYLFLLGDRIMEEGTEKKVAATTGLILGQLTMFVAIYYVPMNLALTRPHIITVLAVPYILFHFFSKNKENFIDSGSTTRNSMRNLNNLCVFVNNYTFQLFNPFILPSSTFARLVNIYMFRCDNKILFVIASFVGWLIGHILVMKWVGSLLFWIRQTISSNKYLVSEFRNSMARFFCILLFLTCVYSLGTVPSPIVIKTLKKTPEKEEETEENEKEETEETDVEMETTSETKGAKQEQERSTEEDPSFFAEEMEDLDKILDRNQENSNILEIEEEIEEDKLWFEKPLVTLLFDYQRRNRPLRYIKNDQFENAIRSEMSQYFFYPCQSDGKQRISFTYPPSLATFLEMLQRNIFLCTTEKLSSEELYKNWVYTNEQKRNNLSNEFINRIKTLDKGSMILDVLDKRTRFCNDETEQQCLPKIYDPFLNGSYRGTMKKLYSHSSINDELITSRKDSIETIWRNKLHGSLFPKELPRWSYKLEQSIGENHEDSNIISRKSKRVVVLTFNGRNTGTDATRNTTPNPKSTSRGDEVDELGLIEYPRQPDFNRELIKGSIRAQRRKIVPWEFFQANVQSPLFSDRGDKSFFFSLWNEFETSGIGSLLFRNWMQKSTEFKTEEQQAKKAKKKDQKEEAKREEDQRVKIAATWETIIHAQAVRGCMLITQSFLRKYIVLPSLIIVKNIVRMLFFQSPEWYKDWEKWNKETHIKCTYSGVQLSETEFPQDWLTEGIQIKILFPLHLKPWHSSKRQSRHKKKIQKKVKKKFNLSFLTVYGMEAELPFGSPREGSSFFTPISEELEKKLIQVKNQYFLVLRILKERTKRLIKISKKKTRWIMQIVRFIKEKKNELAKVNLFLFFGLREVNQSSQNKSGNNSITRISNQINNESSIPIKSIDWTNYSLTEQKMRDLIVRTSIIRHQIKEITKEKNLFLTPDISPSETCCDDKRLESPKTFWQILKSRSARLIRKSHYFFQFFIERIYTDTLLWIINISRLNVQLFLELTKKKIEKYSYNDEINQEEIYEKNKNAMKFFSTIKRSLSKNSNKKYDFFYDLSSLSQAYVFYKLSQAQVITKYNLRSIFQYQGTSLFLKEKIKEDFGTQGILDSESKHKKLQNFGMDEWKNWLRGHYPSQYNLSQTGWSTLVPQKWRNKVNQSCMVQNKDSKNLYSYEKEKDYEWDPLSSKKENLKKHYRYDLLSHNYLNYENITGDISISDYLSVNTITNKNPDRKYFDWRIIHFCLKEEINIEDWTNMDTWANSNTNTRPNSNYYKIVDKLKKKEVFSRASHKEINPLNQTQTSFYWMGMNEEKRNPPKSSRGLLFLPKFLLLYNAYKLKPWIIPIKLLLFHFNGNENLSENKKISLELKKKKKEENELKKKKKEENELKKKKKEEKEELGQADLGSDAQNQGNIVADQQKRDKEVKEYIDFFLKSFFLFQLKWDDYMDEKINDNINIYSFLLRLKNPRKMAISSIGTNELDLNLLKIDETSTELINKGIFFIAPTRLSIKWDGQFLMYQTIAISLVHKSKYQTNQNDFFVPENILSPRRRRELRIRISLSLNSGNMNLVDRNSVFLNGNNIGNCGQILDEDKYLDIHTKKLINLKFFLWPNYRLEDLACMNRYWFDTNNGSRFSMSRIRMYPRSRIS